MKVIIYGLGNKSKLVSSKLKNIHNIVGYTDNKSNIQSFNNLRFYKLEELNSVDYDYIILAIDNAKACEVIIKYLTTKFKIDSSKIVDFYHLYNDGVSTQKVDRVMQDPNKKEGYEGIILGVSHSALGINPKLLKGNFCNLATSSQDIYYNLKTLEYCMENYQNKIENLKYVILDVFDYNYLNYDVSLTTDLINYLSWGGYNLDYHNYNQNRNFTLSVEEELAKINCKIIKPLGIDEINLRDKLFQNIYGNSQSKMFRDFASPEQRCKGVEKGFNDYCLPDCMPKYGSNRFDKTIEENKIYFEKTLKNLYKINPNMKIYAVLIPRYETVEKVHKIKYKLWKVEYEEFIYRMKNKYNFKYLDFKDCKEINTHNEYYQDVAHLNYEGATAFTTLLDSYIDYVV
ncbi:SGNH/GDSL hydrolase family protein [Clostridium gasigenes]|uniref:SGNH/GDSL hydrolase family protein n=1 Tax=Clostridium gasigenes TaxID=94869 RepID=A0A7X0VQC1_9CLOT|nr:SGNH/GDSL hydrolase family protein [Clostridium gasigenes]MBB6714149.1 SGNH/GDSL hydrolase family protein [Clostridium gasigenes]